MYKKRIWRKKVISCVGKRIFTATAVIIAAVLALVAACGYACFEKKVLYPLGYKDIVIMYADEFNLPRALVFAVIKAESGFDEKAVSSAGAMGLMQIKSGTGRYIAQMAGVSEYDLFDPNINVRFGCCYINYLLGRFGDVNTALAAYNAGEGKVAQWLKNPKYSDNGKTFFVIPYGETADYTGKINRYMGKYERLYGKLLNKT